MAIKSNFGATSWVKVYAWYPVTTVFDKKLWLKWVYKRKCQRIVFPGKYEMYVETYTEYATTLDLLRMP